MHRTILPATLLLGALLHLAAAADKSAEQAAGDLQMQYAKAKLQLAQTNLRRIEELNRKLQRSVPAATVAEYQGDVAEAQQQVDAASIPDGGEFGVWLRRAQSEMHIAATRWKNAVAANQSLKASKNAKEMFGTLDVERFRLRAEVNRLQWERGRTLIAASKGAQLAWQIELLNNQVDRLREDAAQISPFVRYYPIYWFPY